MLPNLKTEAGYWVVDGERKHCLVGRDGFKLLMWVANGEISRAERWIERNQDFLGRNHVQRVFGETGGWGGHPMFGSSPTAPGIWDLSFIRKQLVKHVSNYQVAKLARITGDLGSNQVFGHATQPVLFEE